jgi:phosphoenolpyruvate-protein kinase (PTS system EI component)
VRADHVATVELHAALIKAIVTDHGSYASHAGIVSREMAIDFRRGRDGPRQHADRDAATIHVDGSAGVVRMLD